MRPLTTFRHGLAAGVLLLGGSLGLALGTAGTAGASTGTLTLFVTPSGSGTTCSSSVPCTLAHATAKVTSAGKTDVVTIHAAKGTYLHAAGLFLDSGTAVSVTLIGAGTSGSTASILNATSDNFALEAEGTKPVTISAVQIIHGTYSTSGGCVIDLAPLTMTHVDLTNCSSGRAGGGIYDDATLHLSTSTVSNSTSSAAGGGIYVENNSTAVLVNDNLATDIARHGSGGGLADQGTAHLTDTVVVTGSAQTYGGDVSVRTHAAVLRLTAVSLLDGNSTNYGGDLGLYTGGPTAILSGSTFTGGGAIDGGGIYDSQAHLTILGDNISDDTAVQSGGGIAVFGGSATLIADTGTTDAVEGDTNATGGFLFVDGAIVTVTNSTIVHSEATYGGGVGAEVGAKVTLTDDTLQADKAQKSSGGGGLGSFDTATVSYANSIFDHATCGSLTGGAFDDNGHNVASTATCAKVSTDVKTSPSSAIGLGQLAVNTSVGTQTMAITPKSSAFEVVPTASCTVTTTQRGFPRPGVFGKNCDAGAYEYQVTGYDLVGSDGGVFVFNPPGRTGGFFGSLPGIGVTPNKPVVGMVPTVTDQGYFLVASDGGVFAFGTAPFLGSLPGLKVTPNQPIAGIVAADQDRGYFLVGKDGGVYAFGTVPFLGSLPGTHVMVNNIIGIAATPSGNGYWLVSVTGTVYAFGAAKKLGSVTGATSPVAAIAGTPTGGGYWVTTQNGAVYKFGTAAQLGTLPTIGVTPAHPIIGIVRVAATVGYWLIGSDGGIFAFGTAPFVGSLPGVGVHVTNIVGAVPN